MGVTKISWTAVIGPDGEVKAPGYTFNPWMGCTKVSAGCAKCYAERDNKRRNWAVWGPNGTRVRTSASTWNKPLIWNREAKAKNIRPFVFTASLADVFERFNTMGPENEASLDLWRAELFTLMENTPYLTWLLLTKRIENVKGMVPLAWLKKWPKNVWIGTTAENQEMADLRIPYLLELPALVRFLSVEPMLGSINLTRIKVPGLTETYFNALKTDYAKETYGIENRIDWVICGGESGSNERLMTAEMAEDLRDQCSLFYVDFFFKQWGGTERIDGHWGGEMLGGRVWHKRPKPESITV